MTTLVMWPFLACGMWTPVNVPLSNRSFTKVTSYFDLRRTILVLALKLCVPRNPPILGKVGYLVTVALWITTWPTTSFFSFFVKPQISSWEGSHETWSQNEKEVQLMSLDTQHKQERSLCGYELWLCDSCFSLQPQAYLSLSKLR